MKKNFFSMKTGHKISDEYFKNMAVWHDIDILKSFIFGIVCGSIFTVITCLSF